jgi:hypothetical protein
MGLYSSLQGYFKAEYSGRYMSHLLVETCRCDPGPFIAFLQKAWGTRVPPRTRALNLIPEFAFKGRRGRRLADLAVTVEDRVIGLVELKYHDLLMPESDERPAQLDDYLNWCAREDIGFLVLHRAPLAAAQHEQITQAGHRHAHYYQLSRYLSASNSQASRLLHEYFGDEGLIMKEIDQEHLYRFLHRLLKHWGGAGRVSTKGALTAGPEQFRALFENLMLISAELTPVFRRPSLNGVKRSATVDFALDPRVDSKGIINDGKAALAEGDEAFSLGSNRREGGTLWLYAQNALGQATDYAYVEYGVSLTVEPGESRDISVFLYSKMRSRAFGEQDRVEKRVPFSYIAHAQNKPKMEAVFRGLVRRAAHNYLAAANRQLTGAQHKKLTKYYKHLVA